MARTEPNRKRMARHFIHAYGKEAFLALLVKFERNDSGQVIADDLGVTRERVRQWRNAFGATISVYQVHPDAAALARKS